MTGYAAQKPMVVVGHHETGPVNFDTINSDDVPGARLAVESLIARGLRRIHMVSLPRINEEGPVFAQRESGCLEAMAAAGLSDQARIWRLRERPNGPDDPMEKIFETAPLPEALFCWSDLHAIEALNEAHLRGIDVPGELSVVGYDNTPVARMPVVGLPSAELRGETLGRLAAKALLTRFEGRTVAEHLLVEPALFKRRSLKG